MLAPPLGSWRPLLGEILDPPLQYTKNIQITLVDAEAKEGTTVVVFINGFIRFSLTKYNP